MSVDRGRVDPNDSRCPYGLGRYLTKRCCLRPSSSRGGISHNWIDARSEILVADLNERCKSLEDFSLDTSKGGRRDQGVVFWRP